ncbi:hypothetical protein Q6267_28685, partial [Klebsiella pneumoniae]|nr:hypothetical protein [Klebsiella pneumoniae]
NFDQNAVADHSTPFDPSNPSFVNEKRNVLAESSRIGRGQVSDLDTLNVEDFDGVILPGGYGVPINFGSNFSDPKAFEVHPLV